MADTIELATYEQIAVLLSQLMTNYNALADTYFNMFYDTVPADINITLYNSDGTLTEYTIPNRAKDFNFIRNGEGNPEDVVRAPIGTTYQDTKNGAFYLKEVGTGSQGWVRIPINTNIDEGNGSPEGILVRGKGTLYIDKDEAAMYIKTTPMGNTGWSLIAIDTNGMANADLSNLSPEGENHFANASLSNLDEYGRQLIDGKASVDLDNLSPSGEGHFANPNLDNLSEDGKARIAVKEYLDYETYSADDVVLSVYAGEVKLYRSLVGNNQGNPLTDATKWQEVQLGGGSRNIGEIVSSTLPIADATLYLLNGDVLKGSGIYADFVNYIADLYEENSGAPYFAQGVEYEFIPTGNLNNNNGVISGFTTEDYCKCNITFNPGTDIWEMNWKVITGSNVADGEQEIISADGSNELELGINGGFWEIELTGSGGSGSYEVLPNTTYYLRLAYDGTDYTLEYSTDGVTYINDITLQSSATFSDTDIYIGIDKDSLVQEWEGAVDLWGCNISVNGTTVWEGVHDLGITPEEAWWDSVDTYGVCGKFVYNPTNRTVRLPLIEGFTEGTVDINVLGNLVEAGLPDHTHFIPGMPDFSSMPRGDDRTGCVSYSVTGQSRGASETNSIYGNSNTVQPQSIKVMYYIVVGTGVKSDIVVNIDRVAADLANKADKSMVPVERIYDTGWLDCAASSLYTFDLTGANILNVPIEHCTPTVLVKYLETVGSGNAEITQGSIVFLGYANFYGGSTPGDYGVAVWINNNVLTLKTPAILEPTYSNTPAWNKIQLKVILKGMEYN